MIHRPPRTIRKVQPFERFALRYDDWFEQNYMAYQSELQAVRDLLPKKGKAIEIGVGRGRFAAPLGVQFGLEPSIKMCQFARRRGIKVVRGFAQSIPLADSTFDYALMVTTICFLENVGKALSEVYRILRPGGIIIIGFIDRCSWLEKKYRRKKKDNVFYRVATFYSVAEVIAELKKVGFTDFVFRQTLFHDTDKLSQIEPVMNGFGKGSFVAVRGKR